MRTAGFYGGFQARAERVKDDFLAFLIEAKRGKRRVAAYGAAAKGNTLLNFAGVRPDLSPFVADRNAVQAGAIPARQPYPGRGGDGIAAEKPDYMHHPAVESGR